MRHNPNFAATVVKLAVLFLVLTGSLFAAETDPPVRVGRLTQIHGQVSIEPTGVNQWTQASTNYPMTTGDRLYADQDGEAELQLGRMVAFVGHLTDLAVTNLSDEVTQLGLSQGTLRLRTFSLDPNQAIEVDTPNGAITVMQPGDFRVDSYTGDGGTVVTVNSGEVQITGPNVSQNLGSGQSVRLNGTNPITVTSLSMPGEDPFDAWCFQRTRQILDSQSRQYVNPDTPGSEDLDQYGTWSENPDDGPVWYPTSVPEGWVPYSTGSWVWVSPWGWTWVDSAPWGFAPFHYGRWAQFGPRWGWIPGPVNVVPIYSPALVGFVGGPGFATSLGFGIGGVGLSAWFPLGPGEPYYPWYPSGRRYFTQVNVTNIRRITNITNVNTTNYYNYYHNQSRLDALHYSNRNTATTAVRANQFASGQPITMRTSFHPTAQQMAHAQIIPHPSVNPTMGSVVPRAVTSVRVPAARPSLITVRGDQRAIPGARTSAVPDRANPVDQRGQPGVGSRAPINSAQTPRAAGSQPNQISPNQISRSYDRAAPNTQAARPTYQRNDTAGRQLLSRNPAPSPQPTFEQRQNSMRRDPGRPLDSGQLGNLNRGQPAGPSRTPEFPPHPAYAPRQQYAPPPRMAAPAQGRPR